MLNSKKKTDDQFAEELNEAVRKRSWMPLGGFIVAVPLILFIASLVFAPFSPQTVMQSTQDEAPLRFGANPPKTETYPAPEDDPRITAWIGKSDTVIALSTFLINVGVASSHDYFDNCTAIMSRMLSTEGYKAHLYIVADITYANRAFDDYGVVDDYVKTDVTGTGCAMFIKDAHPQAKIMCLGMDDDNLYDCESEGFYVMSELETLQPDTLQDDFDDMTFFEGMVRDLIEVPLVPDLE